MEGTEEKVTSPGASNLHGFREVEQGVYKWGWRRWQCLLQVLALRVAKNFNNVLFSLSL